MLGFRERIELGRSVTIDWTVRESTRARIRVKVKRILRKVEYIRATHQLSTFPEELLTQDNTGKIGLMKWSNHGSSVEIIRIAPGKWKIETQNELAAKMQHAVDEKRRKLKNVSIGPRKAILILYDAYEYAEPEDAMVAMQAVTGNDWFLSIFWAASFADRLNTTFPQEPGREGVFLFSHNPCWNGKGTVLPYFLQLPPVAGTGPSNLATDVIIIQDGQVQPKHSMREFFIHTPICER